MLLDRYPRTTSIVIAMAMALILPACASTEGLKRPDPLGITITIGVLLDQSDDPRSLATNIVAGVEDARKLLADGEVSTLDTLALTLNRKIAQSDLSQVRKAALFLVVDRLASVVARKLSIGDLTAEDIVYLGQVLDQIDASVILYYPEIPLYGVAQRNTV